MNASPRQCRLKLNQMEAWFRDNLNRYSLTEQVVFRSLFEIAATPHDVVEMGKALRDRMLPERQDHPLSQPMDSSMIRALSAAVQAPLPVAPNT